jgi:phage tail sheath protein FI
MPEYLAPGVYVEETSFRAKSIEGVSTSTAGFVGPALYGPTSGLPELITSFAEFERVFGGLDRLDHGTDDVPDLAHNYLAHGVRSFFDNGGSRVYVSRIYNPPTGGDGRASTTFGGITVTARFPGRAGNARVSFTLRVGGNVLASDQGAPVLRGVAPDDVVWVSDAGSPAGSGGVSSPPGSGTLFRAERVFDDQLNRSTWTLRPTTGPAWNVTSLQPGIDAVHKVSVGVEVTFLDRVGNVRQRSAWEDLGFTPGARGSLGTVFADDIPNRGLRLRTPIVFTHDGSLTDGPGIAAALLTELGFGEGNAPDARGSSFERALAGGSDGDRVTAGDYEGEGGEDTVEKTGLAALEDIPDISIVAAPGYSAGGMDDLARMQTVTNALISHCERMKYRIAVLDSADGAVISEVRAQRAQVDSSHAALYYPWVRILDPVTDQEIVLPPSGFVAGIYARNDVEKGVHKAPANEVVRGALGFEVTLNKGQQDVLNPEGINAFRYFEGRGNRLWGARTISSDPEWKYVNLRRYFAYLERSIERGTQWVVFENNSEPLWANVRRTIEDFLYNEFRQAHLMGDKPETSYFVKCDRSTMTQNDFDNGRLICLIGVAPVRPAEFVIFRIGQWTGDRKV